MVVKYIIRHASFNRQARRHNPEVRLYQEEDKKLGLPPQLNKPYLKG